VPPVSEDIAVSIFRVELKTEASCSTETLATIYQTMWHVTEHSNLHAHRRENINSLKQPLVCFRHIKTVKHCTPGVTCHTVVLFKILWTGLVPNIIREDSLEPKRDAVTGGWRKLHNEELHNLYSSPNIIRMIKPMRIKLVWHVECNGAKWNVYIWFSWKARWKDTTRKN
jgi:hypothetical protein